MQGRVESRSERDQIAAYAADVAGARNVPVNIEVRSMTALNDRSASLELASL